MTDVDDEVEMDPEGEGEQGEEEEEEEEEDETREVSDYISIISCGSFSFGSSSVDNTLPIQVDLGSQDTDDEDQEEDGEDAEVRKEHQSRCHRL